MVKKHYNSVFHTLRSFLLLVSLACTTSVMAQEGHPLSGTWLGDWGTGDTDRNFLTLIMAWDGAAISGLANPGPNSTTIDRITLTSSDWSVQINMPLKDDDGLQVVFVGQGKLESLGLQTRTLNGTWEADGKRGTFTLTRQSGA